MNTPTTTQTLQHMRLTGRYGVFILHLNNEAAETIDTCGGVFRCTCGQDGCKHITIIKASGLLQEAA